MFCRFCGKTIDPNAERCIYCGKTQWEDTNTSNMGTPAQDTNSGFMQAPSLDGDPATPNTRTTIEPVAVEPPVQRAQSDSVYPPRANPMQQASDLSAPRTSPYGNQQMKPMRETPVYRQQEKPVTPPPQEVIGYNSPVTPPVEPTEPDDEPTPKKKKSGAKAATVFGIILFLAIVLAVGWYFSAHNRFDLNWEQTERKTESIVTDKLSADRTDAIDEVYIESEDISSCYYTLDNFENVGEAELICHFENKKLSGVELYADNGDALIEYICNTFDIDSDVVETQAQLEYNGTYVVIRREGEGARALFADTTYGGVCSIELEPYFGI